MATATPANGNRRPPGRGLPNLKSTADALPCIIEPKNIALFEKYDVLSENEIRARYAAASEQYAKLLNIEANTMSYMVRHLYLQIGRAHV